MLNNQTRRTKEKESMKYVSNAVYNMVSDNKIIAVSSTLLNTKSIYEISEDIIKEISKHSNKKILLINCGLETNKESKTDEELFNIKHFPNLDVNEIKGALKENKDLYSKIFINIPSVNTYSDALEIAKECGNIILIEKYSYSKYKNFEETIMNLKENNIKISAVVPIK